jgi:hypothetical protein
VVKRAIAIVVLLTFGVLSFWYALSSANTMVSRKHANRDSLHGGLGTITAATMAGAGSGGGGGGGGSVGGGGAEATPGSPATGQSPNTLQCQMSCRTGGGTCQGSCYQRHNVTGDTQSWSQCMQDCGSKISFCLNGCASGTPSRTVRPSAVAPIAAAQPAAPAASSRGSAPTRSMPIAASDNSSQ